MDLKETNDLLHANGVLLERLDSKIDTVIELIGTLATKTDLAELDVRLSERISRLESAVRQNTEDLCLLRDEVVELRLRFDRRDLRADELERRIAELEKRAGISRR